MEYTMEWAQPWLDQHHETMKRVRLEWQGDYHPAVSHMLAASFGEAVACLV
jgi:hypothetical protein